MGAKMDEFDYSGVTVKHIFKDGTVRDTVLGYDMSKTITPLQRSIICRTILLAAETAERIEKSKH